MHAFRAGRECSERVGDGQSTIAVAVPVNANLFAAGLHHFVNYETDQRSDPRGRNVPAGVADHDGARATLDGRRVKTLYRFGIAARGVFGYVHHFEADGTREGDGALGGFEQEVVSPVFGVAADGARSDEGGYFDGNADLV